MAQTTGWITQDVDKTNEKTLTDSVPSKLIFETAHTHKFEADTHFLQSAPDLLKLK